MSIPFLYLVVVFYHTAEIPEQVLYRLTVQGIILVIQKWVLDDFRESADVITGIMTVLDGRAEENFEAWRKEQQKT